MMHRFQNATSVIACLLLGLTAACQSNPHVSDGRFTSPDGLLSVEVPKLGPGQKTEDQFVTDPKTGLHAGFVSFHDDFGSVRSITYGQVPLAVAPAFDDPARVGEKLRTHAREQQLPIIQQYAPQASLNNERALLLDDGTQAWFAVIEIPAGSTLMVKNSQYPQGRRLDTTRPSLFFYRDGVLFNLSGAQDFGSQDKTTPESRALSPQELTQWQQELKKLYASMRLPAPAAR